jgi:hypothetical protein
VPPSADPRTLSVRSSTGAGIAGSDLVPGSASVEMLGERLMVQVASLVDPDLVIDVEAIVAV